jgi:hypothetical protein
VARRRSTHRGGAGGIVRRLWGRLTRRLRWWGARGRTSKDYDRFFASPAWTVQRTRVYRRDGGRCRACGGKATEVHHRWYAVPIAATPDAALESLCEAHHLAAHRAKRPRRLW